MADISKGKRSTGRRSSILKRVLHDISINKQENREKICKRRPSKRVSFAETYVVKEFPRDSPQTLKNNTENEAKAEDDVVCRLDNIGPHVQPTTEAEQSRLEGDTSAVSFCMEEGETTFISGMAVSDDFPRESTRIMDQDLIVRPPPQQCVSSMNRESVSTEMLGLSTDENSVFVHSQALSQKGLRVMASSCLPPASTLQNRTVLFDAQDEGSMELTLMDTSRVVPETEVTDNFPKIPRDFLRKLMGTDEKGLGLPRARVEEGTVLFADLDQGNTMELTGVHNLQQDCTFAQAAAVIPTAEHSAAVKPAHPYGDRTVLFGADLCDMDLTHNLSVAGDTGGVAEADFSQTRSVGKDASSVSRAPQSLLTAKSFLASLKSPSACTHPSWAAAPACPAQQEVDVTMTMELTGCQEAGQAPAVNDQSHSLVAEGSQNMGWSSVVQPVTAAAAQQRGSSVGLPAGNSMRQLGKGTPTGPAQNGGTVDGAIIPQTLTCEGKMDSSHTAEDMELTCCVDDTGQLLPNAGFSFVSGSSAGHRQTASAGGAKSTRVRLPLSSISLPDGNVNAVATASERTTASLDVSFKQFSSKNEVGILCVGTTSFTQNAVQFDRLAPDENTIYFSSEKTSAAMEVTEVSLGGPGLPHATDSHPDERTVRFSSEDTCAGMELTKGFVSPLDKLEAVGTALSETEERTIRFAPEDAHAAMDITKTSSDPAREDNSALTKQFVSEDRTVRFDGDTRAAMDLTLTHQTCISNKPADISETVTFKRQSVPYEDAPNKMEKTVLFSALEETKADMSFTCNVPSLPPLIQPVGRGLPVDRDEESASREGRLFTPSHKRVSSEIMSEPVQNKTLCFATEETAAQMNMTTTFASHGQLNSSVTEPSDQKETEAKRNIDEQSNKTVCFAPEETAAQMNMIETFSNHDQLNLNLTEPPDQKETETKTSKRNIEGASDKTVYFAVEETAAQMNVTTYGQGQLNLTEDPSHKHGTEVKTDPVSSTSKSKEETAVSVNLNVKESVRDKTVFSAVQEAEVCAPSIKPQLENTSGSRTEVPPADQTETDEDEEGSQEQTSFMRWRGALLQLHSQMATAASSSAELSQPPSTKAASQPISDGQSLIVPPSGQAADRERETGNVGKAQEQSVAEAEPGPQSSQTDVLDMTSVGQKPLPLPAVRLVAPAQVQNASSGPVYTESNKRKLQSLSLLMQGPSAKTLRLGAPRASVKINSAISTASRQSTAPAAAASLTTYPATETNPKPTEERVSDNTPSPEALSGAGRSGSGTSSLDIFGETMPELPNMSGMPGEASSNPLSASVNLNPNLTSSISLGRSFVEKKGEPRQAPASIEDFLASVDVELFQLNWCRRNSIVSSPVIDLETEEDQLNAATVTSCESEVTKQALQTLVALVKEKERAASELEAKALSEVGKVMSSGRIEVSSLSQSVQNLLTVSRKQVQSGWKVHKAGTLQTCASLLKKHFQAMCGEMGEMTSGTENMVAMNKKLKLGIDEGRAELEQCSARLSRRKHNAYSKVLQQKVNHKQSELDSLREEISEAQSARQGLEKQICKLHAEKERMRMRQRAARMVQEQLTQACDKLSYLNSVHSWRPVSVEDERIQVLLLSDAVLLMVQLHGTPGPQQKVDSLSVTNRLREQDSRPWAVLATRLVVDGLHAARARLLASSPSRLHLPKLLDEASRVAEDARSLSQELKFASFKCLITISGPRVTAEVFNVDKLRKVALTVHFPPDHYPARALDWHARVVMGDVSEAQIQAAMSQVSAGSRHFTRVLQAVQNLLKS